MKHLRLLALLFFCTLGVSAAADKPAVTVSIVPLKTFVEKIAGDAVEINVMVLPGSSPATYEPKPSQMRALSRSALYFAVGVPFEATWLPRFADLNPRMRLIATQEGLELLEIAGHDHEEEEHGDHDDDPEAHTGKDPHIWLSPAYVRRMAATIQTALADLLPEHAARFDANYAAFIREIDATDARLKTLMAPFMGEAFMVFHPSWGYFAKEYGLKQLPIEIEGKEPKPAALGAFIKKAKHHKVKAIFVQPEFSQKAAQQIAKEVGVKVISVPTLSPDWSKTLIAFAQSFHPKAP